MVDVGTSGQCKKQHNPDGAADREAVHPARAIRIGFAFERRERFGRGRENASGSNRWRNNWIGDPLFRRRGRFQLWERNLNFGRRFGRWFWNGDGNNGFLGDCRGWWPRTDRRKFQERRQWRRFPLLKPRMGCERGGERGRCRGRRRWVGGGPSGLPWGRVVHDRGD